MTFTRMDRIERFAGLKAIGCLACRKEKQLSVTCGPAEIHHLNSFGHAGMARRGDEYTIGLGAWHHKGEPPEGMTASEATFVFGPSLARSSKRFREAYGTDDELLNDANERLAQLLPAIA
jgi:hypothetical protein